MELFNKLRRKFNEKKSEYLFVLAVGIPLIIYILGYISTGLSGEFSVWPTDVIQALFSPGGKSLVLFIALTAMGIWVIVSLRGYRHFGMKKDERNFWYSDKGTYGTATFMDYDRMNTCFNCVSEKQAMEAEGNVLGIKDGLCVSRPAESMYNKNVAAFGSSGSMKSRAVVRNAIIGCQRRGESMLLTDPKSELFRETAVWLRKSGYVVRSLNLVSLNKSNGWNFMEDALKDADGDELEIVEQISHVIISNTKDVSGPGGKDDFWDKGERGLLKAIMLYQFYRWKLGVAPLAFSHAYDFLLNNDLEGLRRDFEALNRSYPGNAAWSQYNIFLKAGERVCPNIHFGLLSRLSIFNNQRICEITGKNQMDLELPAKQKCAYFIITPDQESTYDFVACLFFTLFFIRVIKFADTQTVDGMCPVPVNLLLDEFPNIGEIPDFAKKMATVRSRDVRITILFQSIPQLKERYPYDSYYGILANADIKVFLGTDDPITAKYVSDRSGETTIVVESEMENHSKFNPTHFTSQLREVQGGGKRMILTPNEVQTMAKNDPYAAMVILSNQPVLLCQKFDYIRNPEVKDWEPFTISEYDPSAGIWGADEGTGETAAPEKPAADVPPEPPHPDAPAPPTPPPPLMPNKRGEGGIDIHDEPYDNMYTDETNLQAVKQTARGHIPTPHIQENPQKVHQNIPAPPSPEPPPQVKKKCAPGMAFGVTVLPQQTETLEKKGLPTPRGNDAYKSNSNHLSI